MHIPLQVEGPTFPLRGFIKGGSLDIYAVFFFSTPEEFFHPARPRLEESTQLAPPFIRT